MKEISMWRYALPNGNAARGNRELIKEVTVSIGRKYLTDADGRHYSKIAKVGNFGIPFYPIDTVYCDDYCLFDRQEAAEKRARGDRLLKKLRNLQFKNLPVDLLEQLVRYVPDAESASKL